MSALSAALLLVALRWTASMTNVAVGDLRDTQAQRARSGVLLVEEDLRRVQHCDPSGFDPLVTAVAANQMSFLSDADANGLVEMITWRVQDGYLERAVSLDEGGCRFSTPPDETFSRVLSGIRDGGFVAIADGELDTAGKLYGACDSEDVRACATDAVQLRLVDSGGVELRQAFHIGG